MSSSERFQANDLESAISDLSMCKFFPTDAATQAAIGRLLAKICPHREALLWLVDTMVNRVGAWNGPMELRGVLCWKYKPADGIEATSSTIGFRPEDGEQQSHERHLQLKADGWVRDEVGKRKELAASNDPDMARMIRELADRKRLM